MERIITGIFDSFPAAEDAADDVARFGLRREDVQILSDREREDSTADASDASDAFGLDAAVSGVMGGGTGRVGAAERIRRAGIPNDKGLDYENDLRNGRILWAVRASEDESDKIAASLRRRGAAKVDVY